MKILFSLFILVLGLAVIGVGQTNKTIAPSTSTDSVNKTTEFTKQETEILGQLLSAELTAKLCSIDDSKPECRTNAATIAETYAQISRSPKLIRYLAAQAISEYEGSRRLVKSAPQGSQIADEQNAQLLKIIVAQNQRIIELLEKLAKGIK